MGVRINMNVSTAKASAQQAPAKKDAAQPAGTDADFSKVLAKAQPKKKADAAPPSDKPAEAKPTDDKPVQDKATPAAKVTAKKPSKGKVKSDSEDDSQPTAADDVAPPAKTQPEDEDPTQVVALDDVIPTAEVDDDTDKDDAQDNDSPAKPAFQVDPAQVVVQTPAPVQIQKPQDIPAESENHDDKPIQPLQAKQVESQPTVRNATPAPMSADNRKDVKPPVDEQPVVQDETKAPNPSPTLTESKVAVRPVDQQTDNQPSDADHQNGDHVSTQAKSDSSQAAMAANPAAKFGELFQDVAGRASSDDAKKPADKAASPTDIALTAAQTNTSDSKSVESKPTQLPPAPVAPDVRFAEDNHPKVVTAVKSQLLPGGGSIQLRLDPPDLGPLRLEVRMEDGTMSASFVTASDQATSLLTHTLGQLKHALEGAGISVDKLQVRQDSSEQFAENSDQRQQGGTGDQSSARQEQQRREMLNRMWRKVAGGDPLDLVA